MNEVLRVWWNWPAIVQEVDRGDEGRIGNAALLPRRCPAVQVDADDIGVFVLLRHFVHPNARPVADIEYLQRMRRRSEIGMVQGAVQSIVMERRMKIV